MAFHSKNRRKLEGFNNLTKSLSFNLYDFVVARTEDERASYREWLDENYNAKRVTALLTRIAELIEAEILATSEMDFDPVGASSMLLLSDKGYDKSFSGEDPVKDGAKGVSAHLDKSHVCAHLYPETNAIGACSVRLDINVSTCGEIVPLKVLDFLLGTLSNDIVIIDYIVRGFTRNKKGERIHMDHPVKSLQDYVSPHILERYICEDLVLSNANIWQTKMLIKELEPSEFFKPGVNAETVENKEALASLRNEMVAIFHGHADS